MLLWKKDWTELIPSAKSNLLDGTISVTTQNYRYRKVNRKERFCFIWCLINTPFMAKSGGQTETGVPENQRLEIAVIYTIKEMDLPFM
jgi:hypothetical protein